MIKINTDVGTKNSIFSGKKLIASTTKTAKLAEQNLIAFFKKKVMSGLLWIKLFALTNRKIIHKKEEKQHE